MKPTQIMDEHMAKVPKDHFAEPLTLPYDVYLRLNQDHFIQIGRSGTVSHVHQLKAYASDMIPHFFIHRGEYHHYVEQAVSQATVMSIADQSPEIQTKAVSRALGALFELTRTSGFTPAAWENSKVVAGLLIEMVQAGPAVLSLLAELQRLDELFVRHCVAVAMVSLSIGRERGLNDEELQQLAVSALLHDIGMLKLPEEVTHKPLTVMSAEQKAVYETHAFEGANLLRENPQVPGEITAIVYEHHENEVQNGYPRQLSGAKIHPLAKILGLADHFCELTVGDPQNQDFLSAGAAVNTIANVEGHPYDLTLLKILEKLVHKNDAPRK